MPQLKRPLNDGPDRPPKRKKLFGQSKFNPSRNLGAFGPKTLFAVLSDAGRGGSAAMQTFAEYVHRGSKAVVGVVWAQPPVLEVHDLEVAVQGAMDDAVADSLLQLWAKIKNHSMWGKAKVKLILAPMHGTDKGPCKGCLLWSHNTGGDFAKRHNTHSVPGLPQSLDNALKAAHVAGFREVVLLYCYSGIELCSLSTTQQAISEKEHAVFRVEKEDMIVTGFNGVEWSCTHPYGSNACHRFLRAGAPSSDDVKGQALGYISAARVALLTPLRSLSRRPLRLMESKVFCVSKHVVGGGPVDGSRYTPKKVKARQDKSDETRKASDKPALRGPKHSPEQILLLVLRRRKFGQIRVRYEHNRTGQSFVERGRIIQKRPDGVTVRYQKGDGTTYEEDIPYQGKTFTITHVENFDN